MLFLHDGAGGFDMDVVSSAVLGAATANATGLATGDFDGDGSSGDVFFTTRLRPNVLVVYDPAAGFVPRTTGAAVEQSDNSRQAVTGDLSADGLPGDDIFVLNLGQPNEMLFFDTAVQMFVSAPGNAANALAEDSKGAVIGDFSGDGLRGDDIYVVNHGAANELYFNDGTGGV